MVWVPAVIDVAVRIIVRPISCSPAPGRDERNRALGRAGEERVLAHERAALRTAGRDDLARKVRWVAYNMIGDDKQRTLNITIAGTKSCNLQSKPDPEERSLGFALLKEWGIVSAFRQIAHDDLRAIFPQLVQLHDRIEDEVSEVICWSSFLTRSVSSKAACSSAATVRTWFSARTTTSTVFTAINKDTAELHHEQVAFDADLAQRMSDRAVRILQATDAGELLPRIAASRDFFECRFCAHAERCWGLAA